MGKPTTLFAAADEPDAGTGLRAAAALRQLLRAVEELHVDSARVQGWSWQEIADTLGSSRRSVQRRHGRRPAVRGSREG